MTSLQLAFWIALKDLKIELRSRQNFFNTLFFAFLVTVVFNFVFDPGDRAAAEATPAILWVAFLFAGTLSLGHAFTVEKQDDCLMGLLLAPMERGVIFLGKFLANLVFILLMEALILPVFIVFFNIGFYGGFPLFLMILLLVDVGFIAVGTLFSAMTASLKTREVMLPVLLFPVILPVAIAGVRATAVVIHGEPAADTISWLKLLVGFDLVFPPLCYYVFRYVVEETG